MLDEQIGQKRKKIKPDHDASRHSLRHTASYFSVRGRRVCGPFTLQCVAGHDNIRIAARDLHPPVQDVGAKSDGSGKCPHRTNLLKLLITVDLQIAEVVELADTPS